MKRICVFLVAVLLLMAAFTAVAESEYRVVLRNHGNGGVMLEVKGTTAAWEQPLLRPGEQLAEAQTLVIANETANVQTISLDTVELPYDNEAALAYLNHVYITVREWEHILYEGTYSRINDGEFSLRYTLGAHSTQTLSIDLRCDYTAEAVTGFEGDTRIKWNFYHVTTNEVADEDKPAAAFSDPALREILVAAGTAVVLLVGVGVYEVLRRKRGA